MSFNLKEYILYRTEVKRELFNSEVDNNFKMVANPWSEQRTYEEGNVVYHPVIVEPTPTPNPNALYVLEGYVLDGYVEGSQIFPTGVSPTGVSSESLAWWRANRRTTKGVFLLSEWDLIGGIGTGDLSVQGADGFGKILVNYTGPTGSFQGGPDGLITSPNPNATINYVAGPGMQLQWDQTSNTIKFINLTAGGEVNHGINIGTGNDVYAGLSGTDLQFRGFSASNTSSNPALTSSVNNFTNNINFNLDSGQIFLGELSGGSPTADELSDITYPSGLPSNGDLLQWSSSSGSWLPVGLSLLGVNNIYDTSSVISAVNRTVTLNPTLGGTLRFQSAVGTSGLRIDNNGQGFVMGTLLGTSPTALLDLRPNDTNNYQLQIDQKNALGKAVMSFSNQVPGVGETFLIGYDPGDQCFGIIGGPAYTGYSTIQDRTLNNISIGGNGNLYVPYLGSPSATALGSEHWLPFAENNTAAIDSVGSIKTEQDLSWTYDGTNGTTTKAKQFSINFTTQSPRTSPDVKGALWVRNIPSKTDSKSYGTYISVNEREETSELGLSEVTGLYCDLNEYISPFFSRPLAVQSQINRFQLSGTLIGNEYSIRYLAGFETLIQTSSATRSFGSLLGYGNNSTSIAEQFGLAAYWADTSSGSRIGVYSDTANTYSSKFDLTSNGETWSGLFKGCFAIKEGGLVLDTFNSVPSCNTAPSGEIPYEDRTLWINEGNGHLYRGNQDLEASIGGSFKTVIASSSFRVSSDSNNFASDDYIPGTLTEFSIGGDHNLSSPNDFPGSWDSNVWNDCYNLTITATDGSLSSIDTNGLGCLIRVPYNVAIGQYLKIQILARLNYAASGTFIPGTELKVGVMYLKSSDFLDTTGQNTSIELLKSNSFSPTINDSPVAIWSNAIRFAVTQPISANDYLAVGFGLTDFNSSATPSNRLTVSWTLSAADS